MQRHIWSTRFRHFRAKSSWSYARCAVPLEACLENTNLLKRHMHCIHALRPGELLNAYMFIGDNSCDAASACM